MLTVDIKSLLKRLNTYCTSSLEGAAGLCVSRAHYEVTVEHVLVKLLENPQADLALILRKMDLDPGRLLKEVDRSLEMLKSGNAGKPVFSPLLMEWFQEAWLVASVDLEEARVRSGALLLAFLSRSRQLADGAYADMLEAISRDAVKKDFWELVKGSVEKAVKESAVEAEAGPPGEATALTRFCEDFTAKAASGDIDPVFGRDTEIRQMVDILARRRKKQSHRGGRGRCGQDGRGRGAGPARCRRGRARHAARCLHHRLGHGAFAGRRRNEGRIRKSPQIGDQRDQIIGKAHHLIHRRSPHPDRRRRIGRYERCGQPAKTCACARRAAHRGGNDLVGVLKVL